MYGGIASAQQRYWQQEVTYRILVSLNDTAHSLDAEETIKYINHSPDTLSFIFFHLWPNAYKNDKTAFSEQLLRNNDTRFYFSEEKERGYINQLQFAVNGEPAALITDSNHIDIAKLAVTAFVVAGRFHHHRNAISCAIAV